MAPPSNALTQQYRRQQLALRAGTLRDLMRLWPALDWQRIETTYPAWFAGVRAVVARDRYRSSGLASAYLRGFRSSAGVPGEARILLADPVPAAQLSTAARVTTIVAFKRGIGAGFPVAKAATNAFVMSSGSLSRLVLDGGRETVRESTLADPRAVGWQRVGAGGCDFCQMLIGRGDVYSEATADFESHDHCACFAEPVFD